MPKFRTGTIYKEITNSGMYAYGQRVMKNRFVAEITVCGKRYRFRSTNEYNVRRWLADMVEKYREI